MPDTILMVDDTPTCRETIATCLRMSGYRLVCASDPRQALGLLDDCCPDCAVFDLALPGMNGLELAREVQRMPQWRDLPIILFTGSGDVLPTMGDDVRIDCCLVKSHASVARIRYEIAKAINKRKRGAVDAGAPDEADTLYVASILAGIPMS